MAVSTLGCGGIDAGGSRSEEAATESAVLALQSQSSFTAFESGQVRPLALSADGKYLYAVNTPDNRLEIFRTRRRGLEPVGSVMVGLEPVSVAVRNQDEVWVVNHLSDSVSVIDVGAPSSPRVVRTLLVGDEPRDIVFAGTNAALRAFITTARRGQNLLGDPQLTQPGVGRADVWVFDAALPGAEPLTVLTLFADTPRALAVSPDRRTVYAAAFHSGNRTTTINERLVTNNGGAPAPLADADGVAAPQAGLIVKYRPSAQDGQLHWRDELDRVWDGQVNFSLPDHDVFAIDATLPIPAQKSGPGAALSGVGTVLFGMAVNPKTGTLYVGNTEARNDVRFEGHNASGGTGSVRGNIAESRITVIKGASVQPRHLNKHLAPAGDGTIQDRARSLAFPVSMAVSENGRKLYVAALGSDKIGVFDTAALESNAFVPSASSHIGLSGGGPTGVVLDDDKETLYVLTRFDNGISVIDADHRREIAHVSMFNPEPESITRGRRFLYDARLTSSRGDAACASCHVFGDNDSLAWDLGDPDGSVLPNPGPFSIPVIPPVMGSPDLHSMKGPMTTQSLRGMANHGSMHWRGDRRAGPEVESAQPDSGAFDENAAFMAFNVAFPGLLGRESQLTPEQMQSFTDFILQVTYPPNPVRNLDNSLTAAQAAGRDFYFAHAPDGSEIPSDTFRNCNGCHVLDPEGNAEFGVNKPGFFGSSGLFSFESEPQFMKVPHLRNAYTKVGMFGMARTFDLPIDSEPAGRLQFLPPPFNNDSFLGDQVRGFGFTHDGSVDTMFRFFGANVFAQRPLEHQFPNPGGIPLDASGIMLRRQLEAFVLAFDSNLAPVVGQQTTIFGVPSGAASARIDLLIARANHGECEVVVRGRDDTRELGYLYVPASASFLSNRSADAPSTLDDLLATALVSELTFTAVPPGSGPRIGLDRDEDGCLDGDCG